jgi:membrane protein YqaA with SNARE-associated domain
MDFFGWQVFEQFAHLGPFLGLFVASLIAATILPMQSEAILVGLLLYGYPAATTVAVASTGNVLGAAINWSVGRGIERFRHRTWFPVDPDKLERAQDWYRRYGRWTLLLSWAPIVGDPLTVVAGVMRERLSVFLLLVTIAKVARYVALALVVLHFGKGEAF